MQGVFSRALRLRSIVAGLSVVLALVLAATATAVATTTWTVTPGRAIKATGGRTMLRDATSGAELTCASTQLAAKLKSGSGLSGAGIGNVSAWTLATCSSSGLSFTFGFENLPYKLNALSYASGTTTFSITGVSATGAASGCSASLAGATSTTPGTVRVKYSNSTGILSTAGGTLHFWNVSGCSGAINAGDPATLIAQYKVSPKQTITSP